jgi:hypothetical protein
LKELLSKVTNEDPLQLFRTLLGFRNILTKNSVQSVCIKEIEKLVSCVYGVIMHSRNVGRTLEKRVKHSAIPFLYLRSRYICCRKRNVNVTVSIAIQLRAYIIKQISDWFTSIVYIVPASNLRTGVAVWPHLCGHRQATFLSTRIDLTRKLVYKILAAFCIIALV